MAALFAIGSLAVSVATAQAPAGGTAPRPDAGVLTAPATVIGARAPALPANADAWVNSPPLSVESLAGKGVVLFFFDPNSTKVQTGWARILDAVKPLEGKPVIFIGVAAGATKPVAQQYAQQANLQWPIIADASRAVETAYGVGGINDQNDRQVMTIKSDGIVGRGDFADIARSAETAMRNAAWKVDPAEIPDALKQAWFNVEFGEPAGAALAIKKSINSPDAKTKAAAEALKAAVQKSMDELLTTAKSAADEGRKWDAYAAYTQITEEFKGFDLPAEVAAARKELGAATEIKQGIVAKKSLDAAKKLLATGKPAVRKQAETMLKKVVDDMGNSSLGKEAQLLLGQLSAQQ